MPFDGSDLSPVTQKNIAKVRAKENLARLRDFIGGLPPTSFAMDYWVRVIGTKVADTDAPAWVHTYTHICNTAGCIGGWGEYVFGEKWPDYAEVPTLGLTERKARALFHPYSLLDGDSWGKITQRQAMAAIDNVIACGWPKWREVVKTH